MTGAREARLERGDNSDILCDKIVNKKGEEEDKKRQKYSRGEERPSDFPFPPSMMRLLSLNSFSLSLFPFRTPPFRWSALPVLLFLPCTQLQSFFFFLLPSTLLLRLEA